MYQQMTFWPGIVWGDGRQRNGQVFRTARIAVSAGFVIRTGHVCQAGRRSRKAP